MFSKNSSSKSQSNSGSNAVKPVATPPKVSAAGVVPSIVSANLRVTGDLESEGDIQIDGMVEGDVRSTTVTVGEHAVVSGSIEADTVHVAGTVKGQINGKMVELARSAKVTGDIVHESLSIEAGAFVQGLCRHVDNLKRTSGADGKEPTGPNLVVGGGSSDAGGAPKAALSAGPKA
jgi:cytoskeletal protein CcmA (bactofilin family)